MSFGQGERAPIPPHTHLVGWSAPGEGSWCCEDRCVYNSALFENFTVYQLGISQAPTKSICSSRNTAGRTVPASESVHFISLMCILYWKKCQSAHFENAVVAVAVGPVVSGYGRMVLDWGLMAALILGSFHGSSRVGRPHPKAGAQTPILWLPNVKSQTHWKRPRCWERLSAGEKRGDRGWDV